MYLTHSRPDISYAVSVVARYMQQPHELHWKETKRIFHYVQGTIDYGIHYATGAQLDLRSFTDSDWVGDGNDRKSTLGFVFMIGSVPICWSSKKQVTLTLSSIEVEYRGVVNAAIQEVWLHGILTEFEIQNSPTTDIYCDNQSTIKISSDHVLKQRTKHIEVHMHYIRELVHDRTITLHYFPIEDQIADIFTKSFTEKKFSFIGSLFGIKD